MRANRLAGVVVGFVGVAILIGPSLLLQGDDWLLAELALLGGVGGLRLFGGIVGRRYARLGVSRRSRAPTGTIDRFGSS